MAGERGAISAEWDQLLVVGRGETAAAWTEGTANYRQLAAPRPGRGRGGRRSHCPGDSIQPHYRAMTLDRKI